MTISTYENKINYVGDGSTTVFTFVFKVLAENHMKVYLDDVIQGTGYTVKCRLTSWLTITPMTRSLLKPMRGL